MSSRKSHADSTTEMPLPDERSMCGRVYMVWDGDSLENVKSSEDAACLAAVDLIARFFWESARPLDVHLSGIYVTTAPVDVDDWDFDTLTSLREITPELVLTLRPELRPEQERRLELASGH